MDTGLKAVSLVKERGRVMNIDAKKEEVLNDLYTLENECKVCSRESLKLERTY